MNITELKIKNAIYDFGLTDDQISKIEQSFSECKGRQGTTFVVKTEDYVFGIKFDSYDRKPTIIMKDSDQISVLPTTIIGRWRLQYTPTAEDSDKIELLHDCLIEGRRYRSYNSDDTENSIVTANNTAEIKEQLQAYILDLKSGDSDTYKSISDDFLKAIFWAFDKELPENILEWERDDSVRKILYVFEQNNIRLSLSKNSYGDNFKLQKFTPEDEEYNYIDVNRYFLDKLYVWDDIEESEIEEGYIRKCGSTYHFKLINAEQYKHTQRKYRLKVQKEKEEQELKERLKDEAEKRLEEMTPETEIQINGIVFTGRGIKYAGQEITGTFEEINKGWRSISSWGDYYREYLNSFRNPDNLDFNILYEQFCDTLQEKEFDGQLGSIKVKVHTEQTETKNYNTLTRYFINDVRINKDDIVPMLKRAICFDKAEDYEAVLNKVSKCNLQFHDLISNGLQIKFTENAYSNSNYHRNTDKIMKLVVVRKSNKNFLMIGEEEYQISDTNKLINRSIKNKNQRYTPTFSELTALFKEMFTLSDDELIVLFRDGLKEYQQAVLKSEQFLKETLELFKVSEIEKDGRKGYLITGSSGQKYMLTKDLKIYAYPSMSYICVVDKDMGQGFTNDKIVNRIYALANDSRVAKEIYTLKPHAEGEA